MTAAAIAKRGGGTERWLYGPARDLLIGCGLWYAIALVLMAGSGEDLRRAGGAMALPFFVLFFSTPHYGATLLRVYEQREDRRAYTFFASWASALLAGLFILGVYNTWVGSWIFTIYITWSPWHYTGQNYGIGMMFLRRRGVEVSPAAKRWFYASFIFCYALTFLALHVGGEPSDLVPVPDSERNVYRFLSLGVVIAHAHSLFIAVFTAYLVSLTTAAVLLFRRASLRDIAPTAALTLTQALWFAVPLALKAFAIETYVDPWEASAGGYYFLWIAVGHALQYLWITSFYAKGRPGWRSPLPYFAKTMAAGAAIWTLPALVFAPDALGRVPYDAGLAILLAATVNIHHFILDGAIWKLRDGRVARVLLRRPQPTPESELAPDSGRHWVRPAVWVVGALCFALMFAVKWESEIGLRQASASGDLKRAVRSTGLLSGLGRDSARLRAQLGTAFAVRGRNLEAVQEFERSIELNPTANSWQALAQLHTKMGNPELAVSAYENALRLGVQDDRTFFDLGVLRSKLGDSAGAASAFERAVALAPERKINQVMLEKARAEISANAAAADE